jgi:hypothetical protein
VKREPLAAIDCIALLQAILDAQRAVLAEIRGLRHDLAKPQHRAAPLDAADAELLQEIFALVGSTQFAAFELAEALGGVNAQALGQRLAYLQGRTLGGLQVRKDGRAEYGTLWSIEPVAG